MADEKERAGWVAYAEGSEFVAENGIRIAVVRGRDRVTLSMGPSGDPKASRTWAPLSFDAFRALQAMPVLGETAPDRAAIDEACGQRDAAERQRNELVRQVEGLRRDLLDTRAEVDRMRECRDVSNRECERLNGALLDARAEADALRRERDAAQSALAGALLGKAGAKAEPDREARRFELAKAALPGLTIFALEGFNAPEWYAAQKAVEFADATMAALDGIEPPERARAALREAGVLPSAAVGALEGKADPAPPAPGGDEPDALRAVYRAEFARVFEGTSLAETAHGAAVVAVAAHVRRGAADELLPLFRRTVQARDLARLEAPQTRQALEPIVEGLSALERRLRGTS